MATYDFRILLETVEGEKTSYMSQSFVDTSVDLVLSASQAYGRITGSVSCSYQNFIDFSGSDFNTSKTFKDNNILSASLIGNLNTGSIDFDATSNQYDRLLRYKFFGEKVCSVLGLPSNQWVYVDQVRFKSDDESNIFQGNINVGNAFISDTLTFANNANINSDLPFYIDTGSDRYIKFIDTRNEGQASLIFGYDAETDTYEINASTGSIFNIKNLNNLQVDTITASIVSQQTSSTQTSISTEFGNIVTTNLTASGNISASGNIITSGNISASGFVSASSFHGVGNSTFKGNITVGGSVTAQEFITQVISTANGSNTFGNSIDDKQTLTGSVNITGSLNLPDNAKINLGTSNDLELYHTGNHSFIKDSGTGNLILLSSVFQVKNAANNETMIQGNLGGAVTLFHNNSTKLVTQAGGVTIRGVASASGGISSSNATFTGEIDVDGKSNLDAVDIDGAVDMASTLVIASHITSSGNISSSGTILASGFKKNGSDVFVDISSNTNLVAGTNISLTGDTLSVDDAFLKNNADDTTSGTITAGGFITTGDVSTRHITASGNISASGHITASGGLLLGSGKIQLDGGGGVDDSVIEVSGDTLRLKDKGSVNVIVDAGGSNDTGDFRVRAHSGETTRFIVSSSGKVGIGTTDPQKELQVVGDISASGTINALSMSGDGSNITGVTSEWDGTHNGDGQITGSLIVTQNITASGNISASGYVYGDRFINGTSYLDVKTIGNDFRLQHEGAGDIIMSSGRSLLYQTTSNVTKVKFSNDGDVTTSGNIFVSGSGGTNGHITASGNISSSGTGSNYFGGNIELDGSGINITNDSSTELNFNGTDNTNITTAGNMYVKAGSSKKIYLGANNTDSQVTVDTSGMVGIGTTAPTKTLTVAGEISASGDLFIPAGKGFKFAGGTATRIYESSNDLLLDADDDMHLSPDDDLTINHGGTNYVTFFGDERKFSITGNISASATGSFGSLDVNGEVDIDGGNLTVGTALQLTNGGMFNFGSGLANGRITWDTGYATLYGLAGNKLRLGSFNTPGVLTISSSHENTMVISGSNVGIGTGTPINSLDILTSAESIARFKSSDNKGYIAIADDDTEGYIGAEGGWLSLGAQTGVHSYNINYHIANQTVSIGNATSTERLSVTGNIKASGNLIADGNISSSAAGTGSFGVGFFNNKVGIGETTPLEKLHLKGGNLRVETALNTAQSIKFTEVDVERARIEFDPSSNNDLSIQTYDNSSTQVDRLTIKHSQAETQVGIGTTSPAAVLHVSSSSGSSVIPLEVNGGWQGKNIAMFERTHGSSTSYVAINASGGDPQLRFNDGDKDFSIGVDDGLNAFVIASGSSVDGGAALAVDINKNVGIGTTSPSHLLSISSGSGTTSYTASAAPGTLGSFNHYLELYEQTSGSSEVGSGPTMVFSSNYYNSGILKTTRAGIRGGISHAGANASGFLSFHTNVSSPANNMPERMRIDRDGNVGIGTTSPVHALQVEGVISASSDIYGTDLILEEANGVAIDIKSSTADSFIRFQDGGTPKFSLGFDNGDSTFAISTGSGLSGNQAVTIESDGKVGIGTSNPSNLFEVSSTATAISVFKSGNDAPIRVESTDATTGITFKDNSAEQQLYYRGAKNAFYIESPTKLGLGTNDPSEILDVVGNIKARDKITSTTFASGFAGTGFRIETGSAGTLFTVDDLTVRGKMSVFELLIHQIRATNGSLFVSNTGKLLTASLSSTANHYSMSFDTGSGYGHSFQVGDLIRAQRFVPSTNGSGSQVFKSDLHIIAVNNTGSAVGVLSASAAEEHPLSASAPQPGYEYVRIGSTTTADRQGAIYLTADDDNAPFIDVADGVTSHSHFNTAGKTKVRMGKLDGIGSTTFGTLSGYGLYASGSAFLEGSINATSGSIGGFRIDNSEIRHTSNLLRLKSSGQITASRALIGGTSKIAGFNITDSQISSTTGTLVLKNNGQLSGSAVSMSGEITATKLIASTAGEIGGFTIDSDEIKSTNLKLNSANETLQLGSVVDFNKDGSNKGLFVSGSGQFFVGKEDGDFIHFDGTDVLIKSDNLNITASDIDMTTDTFELNATDLDISSTQKSMSFGEGKIKLVGGSTSTMTIGAANSIKFSDDGTDRFMVLGSKTSFSHFNQSTAGVILGTDNGTTKFEVVADSNNLLSFNGSSFSLKSENTTLSGSSVNITTPTFFLGNSSKFISGSGTNIEISSSGFHLRPEGDAVLSGSITANQGSIGGFTIGSNLSATNFTLDPSGKRITLGTSNTIFIADGDEGIFLGNSSKNSAPFSVDLAGAITASSGTIGGFTIGSSKLSSGNLFAISASSANGEIFISSSNFKVSTTGNITASNVDLTGTLSSSLGNIGGFTIGGSDIKSNNASGNTGLTLTAGGQITGSSVLFTGGDIGGFSITSTQISASSGGIMLSGSGEGELANGNIIFDKTGNTFISGSVTIGNDVQILGDNGFTTIFFDDFSQYSSITDLTSSGDNAKTDGSGQGYYAFVNNGEKSFEFDGDEIFGDRSLKLGNDSGNDQVWLTSNKLIPFNSHSLYELEIRIKKTEADDDGTEYFGINGFAADGTTKVNTAGANTLNSQHYFALAGTSVPNDGQYRIYKGYFKGEQNSTPAPGNIHATITDPGYVSTGSGTPSTRIKYFSPLILVNYNSKDGAATVDYIRVSEFNTAGGTKISGDNVQTGKITSNNFDSSSVGSIIDLNDGTFAFGGVEGNSNLSFDGTTLQVSGTVSSSVGNIGGFTINASEIKSNNASGDTGLRLKAGGQITASNAKITGDITATSGQFSGDIIATHINTTSGSIGGFTLGANKISSTNLVLSSSATAADLIISASNFNVTAGGQITASNIRVDGGKVGGFKIDSTNILSPNLTMSNAAGGKITLNQGTTFLSGSGEGQIANGKISFNKDGDITITDATLSLPITQPPSEFFDVANSKFVCLISGSTGAVDAGMNYGTFEDETTITILGTGSSDDINRPIKETIFVQHKFSSGSIAASSFNFGDIIEANKPITLVESAKASDGSKGKEATPLNFASKQFLTYGDRNHPIQVMMYSPFASGSVTMSAQNVGTDNPGGGTFTPFVSGTIQPDGTLDLRSSGSADSGENIVTLIQSTVPIVAQSVGTRDGDNEDATVLMPLDSVILNVDNDSDRNLRLDSTTTVKTFTAVTSSTTAPTALVTPGEEGKSFMKVFTSSNAAQIQYHLTGDGNGSDAVQGIGTNTIGNQYIIPHAVGGVGILSTEPAIISCSQMNNDGTLTFLFGVDHTSASISTPIGFQTGSTMNGYSATTTGSDHISASLSPKGLYIQGTGNFGLRTNTVDHDEYTPLGFRSGVTTSYNQNVRYVFEPANTSVITGDRIQTGKIQSNNLSTTAGSEFNLTDGTFKLGGTSNSHLSFDGSTLVVSGTISSSVGEIGGWTIGSSTLIGGNVQLHSAGTIKVGSVANASTTNTTNAGFFADNNGNVLIKGDDNNTNYLKFDVDGGDSTLQIKTPALELVGGNLKLSGSITSSAGEIGGFTIGKNQISSTNLVLSSSTTATDFIISASNFNVKANGQLTASNAKITGDIGATTITTPSASIDANGNLIANSGSIGGFTISDTSISSSGLLLKSTGQITGSKVKLDGGNIGGFNITTSSIESTTGTLKLYNSGQITGSKINLQGGQIGNWQVTNHLNSDGDSSIIITSGSGANMERLSVRLGALPNSLNMSGTGLLTDDLNKAGIMVGKFSGEQGVSFTSPTGSIFFETSEDKNGKQINLIAGFEFNQQKIFTSGSDGQTTGLELNSELGVIGHGDSSNREFETHNGQFRFTEDTISTSDGNGATYDNDNNLNNLNNGYQQPTDGGGTG